MIFLVVATLFALKIKNILNNKVQSKRILVCPSLPKDLANSYKTLRLFIKALAPEKNTERRGEGGGGTYSSPLQSNVPKG